VRQDEETPKKIFISNSAFAAPKGDQNSQTKEPTEPTESPHHVEEGQKKTEVQKKNFLDSRFFRTVLLGGGSGAGKRR